MPFPPVGQEPREGPAGQGADVGEGGVRAEEVDFLEGWGDRGGLVEDGAELEGVDFADGEGEKGGAVRGLRCG